MSFFTILFLSARAESGPIEKNAQIKTLYEESLQLAKQEKLEDARRGFLKITEIDPNFGAAYYYLGIIQMKSDNMTEAAMFFQKAINHGSKTAMPYYLLGTAMVRNGDFERAKISYLEAVRLDPRMTNAYRDLGILYYQTKDFDNSVLYLKKADVLEPASVKTLWILGLAYIKDGRYEDVVGVITSLRAIREEQKATDLENILRRIHGKTGPALPEEPPAASPAHNGESLALIQGKASVTGTVKGKGSKKGSNPFSRPKKKRPAAS